MSENIYLIGFMGAGKSAVARCLRREHAFELVEMDEQIESQIKMPISKIFETYGEEYFRDLETQLLQELNLREGVVVSCGGGIILREENIRLMRKSGRIVLLSATPETIYKRVKHSHNRPLLEQNKSVSYIKELMEKRRDAYEAAADLIVETDDKSVQEICEELMRQL